MGYQVQYCTSSPPQYVATEPSLLFLGIPSFTWQNTPNDTALWRRAFCWPLVAALGIIRHAKSSTECGEVFEHSLRAREYLRSLAASGSSEIRHIFKNNGITYTIPTRCLWNWESRLHFRMRRVQLMNGMGSVPKWNPGPFSSHSHVACNWSLAGISTCGHECPTVLRAKKSIQKMTGLVEFERKIKHVLNQRKTLNLTKTLLTVSWQRSLRRAMHSVPARFDAHASQVFIHLLRWVLVYERVDSNLYAEWEV